MVEQTTDYIVESYIQISFNKNAINVFCVSSGYIQKPLSSFCGI